MVTLCKPDVGQRCFYSGEIPWVTASPGQCHPLTQTHTHSESVLFDVSSLHLCGRFLHDFLLGYGFTIRPQCNLSFIIPFTGFSGAKKKKVMFVGFIFRTLRRKNWMERLQLRRIFTWYLCHNLVSSTYLFCSILESLLSCNLCWLKTNVQSAFLLLLHIWANHDPLTHPWTCLFCWALTLANDLGLVEHRINIKHQTGGKMWFQWLWPWHGFLVPDGLVCVFLKPLISWDFHV